LFQGWVDKFLVTPKQGIRDTFITATYQYGNLGFLQIITGFIRMSVLPNRAAGLATLMAQSGTRQPVINIASRLLPSWNMGGFQNLINMRQAALKMQKKYG